MWLDGTPYWQGVQMDETALPILLIDMIRREGALHDDDLARFWPMVRKAASFLVCNGPVTQQDRWEEDPGLFAVHLGRRKSPRCWAAADLADANDESAVATLSAAETADAWNANVDVGFT